MSTSVQKIAIAEVNSLSLAQTFSIAEAKSAFPYFCQINNDELLIDSKLPCNVAEVATLDKVAELNAQENIALVVFDTITVETFIELTKHCQLTVSAINAINLRNQQTSIRFEVSVADLSQARAALAGFTLANNIEAALLENAPKLAQPGLLVMDMDSTTIEIECIDEIAALAGVGEEVAEVTELAMQGKLDFAQSLHQRVATLKDAPESILAAVAKDIPLMPGLKPLIKVLKENNWKVAIASGGFTYFSEHLKSMLDLDRTFANQLEIIDGKLTGKVLGDVVDAQAKADSLAILSEQYGIAHNQTVAMGDGANDLVMMAAAYLGVAYHAKPIVLEQADTSISHVGLDCMLHWLA
ncbi:phosphoserine phosphatase SerB [Thalassotalea sp. PLHSN55]|uniref:phosphoserine phosphatase SerB n=1 Tax=Thalassotalea sp. PLHSN55 TaxID=3435888 RepID=UPI003F84B50D